VHQPTVRDKVKPPPIEVFLSIIVDLWYSLFWYKKYKLGKGMHL